MTTTTPTSHEFHYDGYDATCAECVANRESVHVECGGEPTAPVELAPTIPPTTTVRITMADKHRIAADFYAITGYGEQLIYLRVNDYFPIDMLLRNNSQRAQRILYSQLDNPTITLDESDAGEAHTIHVHVNGTYRGVSVTSTLVVSDAADKDLIAAFMADNVLNDARLLDVLVGDAPVEA